MTDQQRKEQLDKLVTEMKSYRNAMEAKDPSLARGVYSDVELKWLCGDCPYLEECEQMRAAGAA
jgi:hypothetical protein